jgi:hypothetical protein
MRDDIFNEAQMIGGIELEGICARGLYAARHLTPNGTMKKDVKAAMKVAWEGADPMAYARAAKMRPTWFDRTVDVGKFELMSAVDIGSVKDKFQRALLAEQWQNTTMSYSDVHEAVQSVNKPKPRTKAVKHCAVCGAEQP